MNAYCAATRCFLSVRILPVSYGVVMYYSNGLNSAFRLLDVAEDGVEELIPLTIYVRFLSEYGSL